MSFCLASSVCRKCGKPLTMFEGKICLECEGRRPGMKTEVSDLKPCPFCGADAYIWSWNYGTAIQCSKFNNDTHLIQVRGKTSTEAIKQWNMRKGDRE